MTDNILRINGYSEEVINRIIAFIKEEKVIIMPCDTIYGFVAVRACEERVRQIKHRDTKPFLYLISDMAQLCHFDIDETLYHDVLQKNWPGNITFIMSNRSGTQTFGVRMPNHDVLRQIIRRVGEPLLSSSVNVSGQPALNDPNEITAQFCNSADLIVVYESYRPAAASTIVNLAVSPYQIIRQGDKHFEI